MKQEFTKDQIKALGFDDQTQLDAFVQRFQELLVNAAGTLQFDRSKVVLQILLMILADYYLMDAESQQEELTLRKLFSRDMIAMVIAAVGGELQSFKLGDEEFGGGNENLH